MSAKFSLSWGSGCKKPTASVIAVIRPQLRLMQVMKVSRAGLGWNLGLSGPLPNKFHADKGRHPTSRKYYGRLERCLHQTSCAILNFNDQQKWYMTLNEQFNMSIYQVWIHRFLINLVFLGVAPQGWRILYFLGVDVEYEGWVFLEGTLLRSEWDCGCSPQHRFVALQRGGGGGALIMI